ncbi:MAG TPA: hypothetical protein VK508_05960 [Cyclobacteriaceae bacterium]|nr:hypothetical protein [Cyclobacteriaceae bacterium]
MKYGFVILLAIIVSACGSKQVAEDDDVEWKEMDEFHTIMADVYHPLKDSNNLAPIKSGARDLAAAATKWAQSPLPKKVDNDETRGLLSALEEGSGELAENVGTATDDEIAAQLTALHSTFHSIMEKWHTSGKEEHHDH